MSKKLINKMIDNYNEENMKSLDKHIEENCKNSAKPVYGMVEEHKGPTKVAVTEKSMKKLSKVVLDL